MHPACIVCCVAAALVVGPGFMIWPVIKYAALVSMAIIAEPKECPCAVDASAGRRRRDAIALLSTSQRQEMHYQLVKELTQLDKHFNRCFRKDVLVFHVGAFPKSLQAHVHGKVPLVRFVELRRGRYWQDAGPRGTSDVGAASAMWYAKTMFRYLETHGYKWVMRVDPHSMVMSCIGYDVFQFMEDRNYTYGYRLSHLAHPLAFRHLPEAAGRHLRELQAAAPPHLSVHFDFGELSTGGWDRWTILNAMMITKVSFWTSAPVVKWLDKAFAIMRRTRRWWGEPQLHTLSLLMFAREGSVHRFTDWSYIHSGRMGLDVRSVLPWLAGLLLPDGGEWVGGVEDDVEKLAYNEEYSWLQTHVIRPLMRREFRLVPYRNRDV
mmetsp:Transcript_24235/g.76214  ORF Transcript_24235/g.76214 Transcript_24235/m.76214 type:complete len:378 (+) Transcript_24235:68-1201(+)